MFNDAEEAKRALEFATSQDQGRWVATMNTVVISMFQQIDKMKAILAKKKATTAPVTAPAAPEADAPEAAAETTETREAVVTAAAATE